MSQLSSRQSLKPQDSYNSELSRRRLTETTVDRNDRMECKEPDAFGDAIGKELDVADEDKWDLVFCDLVGSTVVFKNPSSISPIRFLNFILLLHFIIGIIYMRLSFRVAQSSKPAAFTIVLTGILSPSFGALAFYGLNVKQSVMGLGLIGGLSFMMAFFLLTSSIYWAELSKCGQIDEYIPFYSCNNVGEMRSIRAYSDILFIVQIFVTGIIMHKRKDLIPPNSPVDFLEPFSRILA